MFVFCLEWSVSPPDKYLYHTHWITPIQLPGPNTDTALFHSLGSLPQPLWGDLGLPLMLLHNRLSLTLYCICLLSSLDLNSKTHFFSQNSECLASTRHFIVEYCECKLNYQIVEKR